MVEKAEGLVRNPALDLHDFTTRCSVMNNEMVAAESDRQRVVLRLESLPSFPSSPESPIATQKEQLTQRWTQVLQSLEQVCANKEEVLVRFVKAWEEWAEHATEEVGSLVPTGCTLAVISSKCTQAQVSEVLSIAVCVVVEMMGRHRQYGDGEGRRGRRREGG